MTDTTEENKPKERSTLTISSSVLKAKLPEGGGVRQNFAQGRGKSVLVEVRKVRARPAAGQEERPAPLTSQNDITIKLPTSATLDDTSLTSSERDVRLKVLRAAAERQAQESIADIEVSSPAPEEEAPQEPSEPLPLVDPSLPVRATPAKHERSPGAESDEESEKNRKNERDQRNAGHRTRFEEPVRTGKIHLGSIQEQEVERVRSLSSLRRAREKARRHDTRRDTEKVTREVILPEVISVQELANRMAERSVDVVKELMKLGMLVTASHTIDADTAELVIHTFGHKVKRVAEADVESILGDDSEDHPALLQPRSPVVTVMGHVDHGKTSLLDALRKANVAEGEAGGITQHIGAYRVKVHANQFITFLDTPGHEAFTAMRSRGAKSTDIVVLVVAADDGIMAQTVEAIHHAKAAGVPIIVAINKIDKPGADPHRVRTELMQHELVSDDLGGDTMMVDVSAKQKLGLEKLMETILLQAEMLELQANPDRPASGVVIESKIDRGRGVVATLLIQRGTLAIGNIIVAGEVSGRVRSMTDDTGRPMAKATPSMPVEVVGLDATPHAGDVFAVVETEKQARDIAEYRERRARQLRVSVTERSSLEELFAKASQDGKIKELPLIIKADVHGSVEALAGAIIKLSSAEVKIRVLHAAAGAISDSDIALAEASQGLVIGFNVRANPSAKAQAQHAKVDVRYYSIIYDAVDDIRAIANGMLSPTIREQFLGTVEIRQVFNITKVGKIAGCYVTAGVVRRGAKVRLLRDNVVIHEGSLKTLKRFKDDVKEAREGFECGLAFENYDDIKEKDMVEVFEYVEEKNALAT
jgi:translation initiation factor IF-2